MQFDRKLPSSQGDVLHPPSFTSEDGGSMSLQNVDIYVPKNVKTLIIVSERTSNLTR